MADRILEQEDLNIKRKSVMRSLQRLREDPPDISGSGRKGDTYRITDDEYEFNFDGHEFDIPKDQIASACAWYVEPNGLSRRQVCAKLWSYYSRDIDEEYLTRIFKCLKITKSSNGLAPHIIAEYSEEEVADFYMKIRKDKIDEKLSADDQWRLLYENERKKSLALNDFLNTFAEALESSDVPNFNWQMDSSREESDMVIVLSDWHVGMKHVGFNKDIYRSRIGALCQEIVDAFPKNVKRTHVLCLGDMLDGPLSNMRPEQHREQDIYHEKQVLWAARGIEQVIRTVDQLSKEVIGYGIGGNHGRVTPSYKEDPTRFADKMCYVLAEEMVDDLNISWTNWDGVLGTFLIRGTQILFMHGDRGTKSIKDLVWANRDPAASQFVVVKGHKHTPKGEEVKKDIWFFQNGCICGTDEYSSSHGHGGIPAQIMFEVRDSGPRLPYLLPVG